MAKETPVEIVKLEVDTTPFSAYDVMGNLAEVQRMCDDLATEFHIAPSIEDAKGYTAAKDRRAYWRKNLKQVEDERKRVKTAYLAPLTTFETAVKAATRNLTDVIDRQDQIIKDYEAGCRDRKRERLEGYWETTYPVLALCTGEAEEPLVPFSRIFDPDWVKRMGEIGNDKPAQDAMDAIAAGLANSKTVLDRFPDEIRTAALSELYRTIDLSQALDRAEQEERRRADIDRLEAAKAAPEPVADPEPAPEPAPEPETAPETVPEPAGPEYMVVVPCADRMAMERVVAVLKRHGIKGSIKRVSE